MALTQLAHREIKAHFQKGDTNKRIAVDATCGNGYDTEVLCSLGFQKVIGFDIQSKAIDATQQRLQARNFNNFELHQANHAELTKRVPQALDCAMFNFGYLPHGDKTITTTAQSSVSAVRQILANLSEDGIVTLLCYPGHPEGALETAAVINFLTSQPDFSTTEQQDNPIATNQVAPRLFIVRGVP